MSVIDQIRDMEPGCNHTYQEDEYDGMVYLGTRCQECGVFFPKSEDFE